MRGTKFLTQIREIHSGFCHPQHTQRTGNHDPERPRDGPGNSEFPSTTEVIGRVDVRTSDLQGGKHWIQLNTAIYPMGFRKTNEKTCLSYWVILMPMIKALGSISRTRIRIVSTKCRFEWNLHLDSGDSWVTAYITVLFVNQHYSIVTLAISLDLCFCFEFKAVHAYEHVAIRIQHRSFLPFGFRVVLVHPSPAFYNKPVKKPRIGSIFQSNSREVPVSASRPHVTRSVSDEVHSVSQLDNIPLEYGWGVAQHKG